MSKKQITENRNKGEFLGEAAFDKESLVVRGVTLLGAQSANGYTYSANAMREGATLLEGASQYLNHPFKEGEARDVTKLFGTVHSCRFYEDELKVRGDMHLVDTPHVREEILPRMQHFKNQIGNSIVAWAESEQDDAGNVTITHISKIESCDLVTDPATNKGLFEGINKTELKTKLEVKPLMEFTIADVRKDNKIMEALTAEIMEGVESAKEIEAIKKENSFYKEENATLKAENEKHVAKDAIQEKQALVEQIVKESALPENDENIVSKEWIESLYTKCQDEIDIRKEVADREKFYKSVKSTQLNRETVVNLSELKDGDSGEIDAVQLAEIKRSAF